MKKPNNCFNLTICPVMVPARILSQESRQGRLQVKQMLGLQAMVLLGALSLTN